MKASVYYINRKTNKREKIYDKVYRDFECMARPDNPVKSLALRAQKLAVNYANMLDRSPEGWIFVTHEFVSSLTKVGNRQNNNLHSQLADIFDIQYHTLITIDNTKYRYGFIVKYTAKGQEILENPELFYNLYYGQLKVENISSPDTMEGEQNFSLSSKKFPPDTKKISTPLYNDLNKPLKYKNRSRSGESDFNSGFSEEKEETAELAVVPKTVSPPELKRKPLDAYHPLSEEDASELRASSDREFSLHYINQLMLKLSKEKPENGFWSKEGVMKYLSSCLRHEKRQAVQVNSEGFRFRQRDDDDDDEARKERYLEEIESGHDTTPISQLRRKIAATFDADTAYKVLTGCHFEEGEGNKFMVTRHKEIELSDDHRQRLLREVQAVYGDRIARLEFKEPKRCKSPETGQIPGGYTGTSAIWKAVRQELADELGENVARAWFDKLNVEDDIKNRKIILTATDFISTYIRNEWESHLTTCLQKQGYVGELKADINGESRTIAQLPFVAQKR